MIAVRSLLLRLQAKVRQLELDRESERSSTAIITPKESPAKQKRVRFTD